MIPSNQFLRAYRRNCPDVRFTQDEAAELGRLIHEAQNDAKAASEGTVHAIVYTLNEAGVKDYEGHHISALNVLQGVRRLIERAGALT
jgi:hypothetical protein